MLKVESIENGTVIDHVKAGKGRKVLDILNIDEKHGGRVALMINVPSKRLVKKDIVKIEGTMISEGQTNLVALISPKSTINIIRNGKVGEKRQVEMPKTLSRVGRCPNPNCITAMEDAESMFSLEKTESYRCNYCERIFRAEELVR